MFYIGNAFSIQMLTGPATVRFQKLSWDEAKELCSKQTQIQNVVGHDDLNLLINELLGPLPEPKKISIQLMKGDVLLVAQYTGPRLQNGVTRLPEGAKVEPWIVTLE